MAGESPDKSEQRKSSGETTGSERDPRLAMFREGSPASETSSEPSPPSQPSPAVTDERTAVFRLPPRDRAEGPSDADAEAPYGADAGTGTGEGADAEPSDGAVGAPGAGGASAGAEGGAGTPDAPEGHSSPDDAPAGTDTDGGTAAGGRVTEPAEGSVAEAAARTPEAAPPGAADADAGAEPDEAPEEPASGADRAGAKPGADADADAEAPSDADADTAAGADTDTAAGVDTDTDAAADAAPAAGDSGEDADDSGEGTGDDADDADDTTSTPSSPDAPAGDERLRAAVAAWVATEDDEPEGGSADGEKPQKAASDGPDAAEGDGTAPGDVKEGDAAEGDVAPAATPDAEEGTPAPAAAAGSASAAASEADTPETESGSDSGDAPAKRPVVDQPTTAFKALKRPVVDQPTTALKLPKPATDPEQTATAGAEADAERTSTFVPLRRDDARPAAAGTAARAKPAAPAAAAPAANSPAANAPAAKSATAEGDAPAASLTEAERTRQQPMPPLPPLDLLAELTNTPPPPETPTRTVVRRIKIWTPLVVLLLIVFAVAQSLRPLPDPALTLTADSEYSFDGGRPSLPWPDEGQGQIVVSGVGVVGQFGAEKPVPIASVTKTMTAYIIMRDHPLKRGEDGEAIPVDALAEKEGGYDKTNDESTLNTIKEGDTISVRDALSAIMIPSANNVARLVARWDAGSEEAFVKKMNDTAKELGMTNTTYTDPSGLDATTVSTAADQVKLGQALVKNKAMVDITRVQEWYDPSGKRHSNYNTLMPRNGAIGIKTGSTTKAGGNLLFAAYKDIGGTTQTIVGAVLSQHEAPILQTVNRVSEEVLVATREALLEQKVVKKGDVVGHVDDGLGGQTPVVATKDLTIVGWTGLKLEASITDGGKKLPHTAKAGTVVGSLTAGTGPGTISVPVALQQDLVEPGFGDKLTRIG